MAIALDGTSDEMVLDGNFSHTAKKQRELQYFMSVEQSPIKRMALIGGRFTTGGWRIRLKRREGPFGVASKKIINLTVHSP